MMWAWMWACLGVVILSSPSHASPFTVYWNAPTQFCQKFGVYINVSTYGIVQNTNDSFYGDKVNIFYQPGKFPKFDKEGFPVNGGIPQNGSLATHAQLFINRVNQILPHDYSGVAVLDFEDYYPSFQMSSPQYRNASIQWGRTTFPHWSPEEIQEYAEASFNESARDYFQVLLWIGRELRPNTLWGYYHYPYCEDYNPDEVQCKPQVMLYNNEMQWLFAGSKALYPSIYVSENMGWNPRARRQQAEARLNEALRMRRRINESIPILPYFWYRYHSTPNFLSPVDVITLLGLAKVMGLQGVVVWDSGADMTSREKCLALKSYAEERLGPLVSYLRHLPTVIQRIVINSRLLLKTVARKAMREAKWARSSSSSSSYFQT